MVTIQPTCFNHQQLLQFVFCVQYVVCCCTRLTPSGNFLTQKLTVAYLTTKLHAFYGIWMLLPCRQQAGTGHCSAKMKLGHTFEPRYGNTAGQNCLGIFYELIVLCSFSFKLFRVLKMLKQVFENSFYVLCTCSFILSKA